MCLPFATTAVHFVVQIRKIQHASHQRIATEHLWKKFLTKARSHLQLCSGVAQGGSPRLSALNFSPWQMTLLCQWQILQRARRQCFLQKASCACLVWGSPKIVFASNSAIPEGQQLRKPGPGARVL
jgi:uncharacterized protein (DUF849 family)